MIFLFICVVSSIHFISRLLNTASCLDRCAVIQSLRWLLIVSLLFLHHLSPISLPHYHCWRCYHCLKLSYGQEVSISSFVIGVGVVFTGCLKIIP
jgi:hypothetical protein